MSSEIYKPLGVGSTIHGFVHLLFLAPVMLTTFYSCQGCKAFFRSPVILIIMIWWVIIRLFSFVKTKELKPNKEAVYTT